MKIRRAVTGRGSSGFRALIFQQMSFQQTRFRSGRAQAKAKGYEGEACGECGNFTLVRNGTCMKCDTCGSTTGCS